MRIFFGGCSPSYTVWRLSLTSIALTLSMEEGTVSSFNQKVAENGDQVLHKKHFSLIERLSNRHQTRMDTSRTDPDSSSSPAFESVTAFLSRFSDVKCAIESQLDDSQLISSDPSHLKSHFEKISASISDLENLVAENSYYLPSYDVRSSLKTISDLKQSLENLNSELIPKRKFAFKNKGTKKVSVQQTEEIPIPVPNLDPVLPEKSVRESPGLRNVVGQVLMEKFRGSEVGEFTISDLDSCEVSLIGSLRILFVHRLKNCRVYTGPVIGSILIEDVEGCVFIMASHQIRIHSAKTSDFYLRVRSRPIIEDARGVRFAPYCLTYQAIEKDLRDANLDEETGNWENVDDFRWLRQVQSPNWAVLPENERLQIVNI